MKKYGISYCGRRLKYKGENKPLVFSSKKKAQEVIDANFNNRDDYGEFEVFEICD